MARNRMSIIFTLCKAQGKEKYEDIKITFDV